MDEDLKRIINESVDELFKSAPMKMVDQGICPEYYDICPHCKKEIHEKHEYTEDGGKTWRHSDCKGMIYWPEKSEMDLAYFLRECVEQILQFKNEARQSIGLEEISIETHSDLFTSRGQELFDKIMSLSPSDRPREIQKLSTKDLDLFISFFSKFSEKERSKPDYDPYDQEFNINDYIWDTWEDWPSFETDPDVKDRYRMEYWNGLSSKEKSAIRKKSRKMGRDVYFNDKHRKMFSKSGHSKGLSSSRLIQPELPLSSNKNN